MPHAPWWAFLLMLSIVPVGLVGLFRLHKTLPRRIVFFLVSGLALNQWMHVWCYRLHQLVGSVLSDTRLNVFFAYDADWRLSLCLGFGAYAVLYVMLTTRFSPERDTAMGTLVGLGGIAILASQATASSLPKLALDTALVCVFLLSMLVWRYFLQYPQGSQVPTAQKQSDALTSFGVIFSFLSVWGPTAVASGSLLFRYYQSQGAGGVQLQMTRFGAGVAYTFLGCGLVLWDVIQRLVEARSQNVAPDDSNGDKRDYDRAIARCTKRIELDPNDGDAYVTRALEYLAKGDYDRAIADCTKAIELDPDFPEGYGTRGGAYLLKGDYDRAIADYSRVLKRKPDSAEAYSVRGAAYLNKGDYDRAIADCSRAIKRKPASAEAYCNRGAAYFHKGDQDRAIADYTKAISLDSNDAYAMRGAAYWGKGDLDHAIADYTKAIDLKPDSPEAYKNRGIVYGRKGNHDRAIADLTKALEIDPGFAEAYLARGVAHMEEGDLDRAENDLKKAVALDPHGPTGQDAGQALKTLRDL